MSNINVQAVSRAERQANPTRVSTALQPIPAQQKSSAGLVNGGSPRSSVHVPPSHTPDKPLRELKKNQKLKCPLRSKGQKGGRNNGL